MGFEQALEALYAGDCAELSRLLDRDPSLVHARRAGAEVPYNGYFCEPTLLHHVAGNPLIKPLPETIVGLTEVILHKGAEVDAATRAGPDQPRDIGWSTLGLAATSSTAREAGCQEQLMQPLLDRGADPNFRNGGPLIGALYYGEGAAAAFLARHRSITAPRPCTGRRCAITAPSSARCSTAAPTRSCGSRGPTLLVEPTNGVRESNDREMGISRVRRKRSRFQGGRRVVRPRSRS